MIREQFDHGGERVWLNTAHQGILPRAAAEAAYEAVRWKQHPHEMTSDRFAIVPAQLRATLAALLSIPVEEIVLGNSSSYGLHLIAAGLRWRRGDQVLVIRGDFPSTILPWLTLRRRGVEVGFIEPPQPGLSADDVAAHLTPRTRVLCTTWVHSFTGYTIDVGAIGEVCRARNVRFVLNGSQGVGARSMAPGALPIDALTCVGSKWLCGPYGTGFCWIRREFLASLNCNQLYWLTFQHANNLEGLAEPDPSQDLGARAFDVFGTANFFNFTAWNAAVQVLMECGMDRVAARNRELVERLIAGVEETPFEITSPREGRERSSLVFISHSQPGRNREVLHRLQAAGVDAALRRGELRFSPHVYNTAEHVDRALEVLRRG